MSLTQQEASRALDFLRRLGEAALYASELSDKAGGLVGLEDQVKDALRRLAKAENERAKALHDIQIERDKLVSERETELKKLADERKAFDATMAEMRSGMKTEVDAHNDALVQTRKVIESERKSILDNARMQAEKIVSDAKAKADAVREKVAALEEKHNDLLAKHNATQRVVDDMNSHLNALRK
jgi:chromosome segregation ATPase